MPGDQTTPAIVYSTVAVLRRLQRQLVADAAALELAELLGDDDVPALLEHRLRLLGRCPRGIELHHARTPCRVDADEHRRVGHASPRRPCAKIGLPNSGDAMAIGITSPFLMPGRRFELRCCVARRAARAAARR